MNLLISISASRHIDKFRAEKMFNLIQEILKGEPLEIEGSPFVDCARYVLEKQNHQLYFILLGKDVTPLTPTHCIVIDEDETIVFDPDNDNRTAKAKYLTEPVHYSLDNRNKSVSKEIPFYIVGRRMAGELIE